jgi:hypothetical protein
MRLAQREYPQAVLICYHKREAARRRIKKIPYIANLFASRNENILKRCSYVTKNARRRRRRIKKNTLYSERQFASRSENTVGVSYTWTLTLLGRYLVASCTSLTKLFGSDII